MIDYFETKSQPISKAMILQAYKKVRANRGGSGIDQIGWEEFDKNRSPLLYKLWNRMSSGSYFPKPVKEVIIPKSGGGTRSLGIPTLSDRIAQQVVCTHLERIVEPLFHESSFGYRPNRSCHQAVEQSNRNCFGHDFAIDLDIKSFFDSIDHELMMRALRHYCQDRWVLLYVERWLKSGIVGQDGNYIDRLTGTPQGGVISPLLANIFLHVVFDQWMDKTHPEKPFERYADDIIIHCKTEKQAKFVLKQVEQRFSDCKLSLNPEKTRIVNLRGKSLEKYPKSYDFLGFTIRPQWCKIKGKNKLMPSTFISLKSRKRIMAKFREMNLHKKRRPLAELAKELNPIIRGIINYYCKFSTGHTRFIWYQLNTRLLKWVKWEKGLYVMETLKWLRKKHRERPELFAHWKLVQP
jgi:group II intron reverse transcriptase/maturase